MSSSSRRTLGQVLAAALARHATHTFGLMGNGNAHLIDGLREAGVPFTAVRHEAATVAAADAFTRVSRNLAIATTTYGAGFTNAITPLAEAAQARTPMLVVVGDEPTTGRRPWDVDLEMLAAAVGVRSYTIPLADIEGTVNRAVAHAIRARKPVVIGIPYDLVAAEVPAASPASPATGSAREMPSALDLPSAAEMPSALDGPSIAHAAVAADHSHTTLHTNLDAAVKALARAKRPVVIAGVGARIAGCESELDEMAALLGAPTGSTALARGIFADEAAHLGIVGGFGAPGAMRVIERADVVLAVGASLNQFTMRFGELLGPGATLVRVDVDEVAPPRSVHAAGISQLLLQGDASVLLPHLIAGVRRARRSPSRYLAEVAPGVASGELTRRELAPAPDGVCEDGLLDPRAVAVRIAKSLPADIHITQDGGHFIGWPNMYWPVAEPQRMVMVGTAYQSIGLGFGTVAGIALAAPDTTVVLSTGDGGGLMALADLETAIRTASSLVIVVWNDSAYGAELHLYGELGLDEAPMRIPNVNFASLATTFGAEGVRVTSIADLDALDRWVDAGARGAIVLDCQISPSVVSPHQGEIQRVNGVSND